MAVDKITHKNIVYLGGQKLFVRAVGNTFDVIAEYLAELGGKNKLELRFQNVADTALARLRIDTDYVRLVHSAYVGRVDGQIRHRPRRNVPFHSVFHTLGNRVLVRTRKRRKNQRAAVRLSVAYLHSRYPFVNLGNFGQVGKIQLGVDTLRIHIQRQGNDIDVARALAVSKKRTLDAIAACKQAHFAVCHRAPSIVVRVQGNNHVFAVFQVFAHIFHLICINVGHRVGNGYGQVDNRFIFRRRLPNIQHRVADFRRKFGLCARKAFGGIFKTNFTLCFFTILLAKLCAENGNVDNFLLFALKYLLSLRDGRGIIQMHHRPFRAFNRLEGLGNNMLARLRKHLYRYVVGN